MKKESKKSLLTILLIPFAKSDELTMFFPILGAAFSIVWLVNKFIDQGMMAEEAKNKAFVILAPLWFLITVFLVIFVPRARRELEKEDEK